MFEIAINALLLTIALFFGVLGLGIFLGALESGSNKDLTIGMVVSFLFIFLAFFFAGVVIF